MATEETESPPFLALNNNVLNFVACSNIEYTLYVRDTVTTKIRTELAPYTSNECCDIYEVVMHNDCEIKGWKLKENR